MSDSVESKTAEWYRDYYRRMGSDRNSLLNPEVPLQVAAAEMAMVAAYRTAGFEPEDQLVLDVGCGNGQSLLIPLALGTQPERLVGIDLLPERVEAAKRRLPGVRIECADASKLPFEAGAFDVVQASTMFVQITDDDLAGRIASEMIRVAKPGGHLLVCDWRYDKPGEHQYKALGRSRLRRLFGVGESTTVKRVHAGALVPPVGRRLSRWDWPGVYFTFQRLLPFLVGQVVTVLEKRSP